MANNSPLNIGTDAAGGYLFEEQYGQQFIDGIRREAAVASLARVDSLAGNDEALGTLRMGLEFQPLNQCLGVQDSTATQRPQRLGWALCWPMSLS